jgi:hypothetical protein
VPCRNPPLFLRLRLQVRLAYHPKQTGRRFVAINLREFKPKPALVKGMMTTWINDLEG